MRPSRTVAKDKTRTTLNGWQHSPLKGAKPAAAFDPGTPMVVTVILRPRRAIPHLHRSTGAASQKTKKKHLSHKEFAKQYGASASDVVKVRNFAEAHQLSIADEPPHRGAVVLSGSAQSIAQAFNIEFAHFRHARASYFAPSRAPSVPSELKGIVQAVLGLHSRPSGRRHRLWSTSKRTSPPSVRDLADTYAFPRDTDGTGQTIGLIELGGGFNLADIEDYCARLDIPAPRITAVDVKGGANRPAHPDDIRNLLEVVDGKLKLSVTEKSSAAIEAAQGTVEVTMDIEILAALAPGAHIVVYFATPDEQGIYNALTYAIHDTHHRPDVLSISWGEPEIGLSDAYIRAIDQALLAAAHLGITVFASAGDAGALNNSPDKLPSVNFPASSPHCLSCGGTTPRPSASQNREEIVWNSTHHGLKGITGGGVSRKFGVPSWQRNADVPLGPTGKQGRGVPDLAGPADPRYGGELLVAGCTFSSAGTSAVAPLWAALIARCNQALAARCGHLNPLLYRLARKDTPALRAVTKGHNDVYYAKPGWNPCAGLGTLNGEDLLHHLKNGIARKQ